MSISLKLAGRFGLGCISAVVVVAVVVVITGPFVVVPFKAPLNVALQMLLLELL